MTALENKLKIFKIITNKNTIIPFNENNILSYSSHSNNQVNNVEQVQTFNEIKGNVYKGFDNKTIM